MAPATRKKKAEEATEEVKEQTATEPPQEQQPTKPKNLDQAILDVMAAVPYIQKTGKVGTGKYGYTFASEADLIGAVHPQMLKAGLTLVPISMKIVFHETYPSNEGRLMNRVVIKVKYRLTLVETGDFRVVAALGEGTDLGDKATPKAMTIAHKYAMRQIFNIETGNDPDNAPSVDMARTNQPVSQPAQQPKPTQQQVQQQTPQSHLEVGPLGDSLKRARKAINDSKDKVNLDGIIQYAKTIGFSDEQLSYLENLAKAKAAMFSATAQPDDVPV